MDNQPIVWRLDPEAAAATATGRFMAANNLDTFDDLIKRSSADPGWFWGEVVDFLGIPFDEPYSTVLDTSRGRPWATWFPDGQINLSRACVDRWADSDSDRPAIRAMREDGRMSDLTFSELAAQVGLAGGALRELGVSKGDAVAVYLPMGVEAVVSLLAIARIGAIFVPIFSGYGAEAVAARLVDPRPKVLITADGFRRRGRLVEMKEVADIAAGLAGGVARMLVVAYSGREDAPLTPERDHLWSQALGMATPAEASRTAAEDPVMLAYTSGTTGRPKGAVHVHGGLTVKLAAEGAFQFDLGPGDTLMWATDMGWIMGPWMVVAGLANGSTIATYDGALDYPHPGRLWEIVEQLRITVLGVSPTLIRALIPHGAELAATSDLSSLRAFGSTGEPWNPGPWWWLFEDIGQKTRPIINISGGTEIGACILSVNLLQGLKPTSLGGPSPGMAVDVFGEDGSPLRGEVGELVCTQPWPAMTRGFWGEPERYLDTYWSRWTDVWVHGDWASIDADGFWYLHGRSDDTMNIAGKRIGPAEIESAAIAHPDVIAAAAIGVPDPIKGEVAVVYAVTSQQRDGLADEIAATIASHLGKAFRPKAVVVVGDLPRTRSAKIMRRVVKAKALGEELGDLSSLENPEAVAAIERLT